MRGEQRAGSIERDLRAQIAVLAAVLEEQREHHGWAGEVSELPCEPSETWRAFNLSNVARGWVERAMRRKRRIQQTKVQV